MAKKTSIGGQALLEGIMMRGPVNSAMAVRDPQGNIVLEVDPTKGTGRPKFFELPVIRGIFKMYDSLSAGYKYLMRSADICGLDAEEEKRKRENPKWYDAPWIDKLIMPVATVLAMVLAAVMVLYKRIFKKKLPPTWFILISAVAGILAYL